MTDSINTLKEKSKFLMKRKIDSIANKHISSINKLDIKVSANNEILINLVSYDEMCIVSVFDAWNIIVKTVKSPGNEMIKIQVPSKGKYTLHFQYNDAIFVDEITIV
jgi:hypothetical protein